MSKWEKLLQKILSLSKDMRFDELRRVLESYGYEMNAPRGAAVITRFERTAVSLSRFLSMSQSRKCTYKW